MHTLSVKRNRAHLSAFAFLSALAAVGCSGTDPTGISQTGDALKGGTPAGGKITQTKDHGKPDQAGTGGDEVHGQGDKHSQAGHGNAAEHGAQAGHEQGVGGDDDADEKMDEMK